MNLTNKADNDAERMGLYSAYILSSFPTKSHTNQPRSTLSFCLIFQKKSDQIPISYAPHKVKTNFSKTSISTNPQGRL